jgi:hypothetical protein
MYINYLSLTFVIVLNPEEKGRHFEKHWGAELAKEARETAMTIVSTNDRILRMSFSFGCAGAN